MTDILREILANKETEVSRLNAAALRRLALAAPIPRDFRAAVARGRSSSSPRLIAELKLASPSKGMLAPHMDVLQVADVYAENGAAAISVLTDQRYFRGQLQTLRELRFAHRSPLPLLRKDFVIAESQVYESRASGADALLLIVAALNDDRLADLHALALELGLAALVEIHNEHEAERALKLQGIRLVGINNRDLATFETSLATTERLRPLIPAGILVVSESGISKSSDVKRMAECGVDAVLVGEALVTADDIAAKVRELAGRRVKNHD